MTMREARRAKVEADTQRELNRKHDGSICQALYGRAPGDQMNKEWLAWRQLCKQLEAVGVDINQHDPLALAIKLWGEELVALREENPEHTEKALHQARDMYVGHAIEPGCP